MIVGLAWRTANGDWWRREDGSIATTQLGTLDRGACRLAEDLDLQVADAKPMAGWMLLLDSSVCGLFNWRQFEPDLILLAIGWYLRFSLSYRHVEEFARRAGPARRSRHRLEVGPAVCSGTGAALAPASQADQRLVAGGRDVRARERQMGVTCTGRWTPAVRRSTSFSRLTRCSNGSALSDQSLGW
jgi:hypothetical protein